MSVAQIVLLSALMVATGALGAITGGNSLINVPLMITVGMTPRQAVATNMFAVLFMTVSATARFARAQDADAPACCVPLGRHHDRHLGAGALIAVKLPESVVKLVVGVSMAVLVVFIALHQKGAPVGADAARAGWRATSAPRCSASTAASSRAATRRS